MYLWVIVSKTYFINYIISNLLWQKGKKEKRHKRKKNKKTKGEENSGPVQISKVTACFRISQFPDFSCHLIPNNLLIANCTWIIMSVNFILGLCILTSLNFIFFPQYLKDRNKGKYSMISGKKIKMKVKKSKEDKKVASSFHCKPPYDSQCRSHLLFFLFTAG